MMDYIFVVLFISYFPLVYLRCIVFLVFGYLKLELLTFPGCNANWIPMLAIKREPDDHDVQTFNQSLTLI